MIKAVTDRKGSTLHRITDKPPDRVAGQKGDRTTAEGRTDRPKAQGAISERRRRSIDLLKRENPPTSLETAKKPEDSDRGQADNGRKTAGEAESREGAKTEQIKPSTDKLTEYDIIKTNVLFCSS